MNAKTSGTRSRVIVAIGPASPDPPALIAAAQLAQSAGAELAALFVEDINLLRLAQLPFAQEIGMASATMRRLVAADVERALKRQAEELRGALAEMAHAARLDWTFATARGRPARVLLEAAGEGDYVVLASTVVRTLPHADLASAVRNALRVPWQGARPRHSRTVAAVLQPGPGAMRALVAAHQLALSSAAGLTLVLAGPQDAEFPAVVEAWLHERSVAARVVLLPGVAPEQIAQLAAVEDIGAIFWLGDGIEDIEPEVEALLKTISCPVVIVR
jgi:hypothetical protein